MIIYKIIKKKNTMRKVAVIPARGGSTRLKNKNIRKLAGKPLIRWMTEAVVNSKVFDTIYVSTDSDAIFDAVKDLPVKRHIRPVEHATTKATALNAMLNMMENMNEKYDIFAYFLPTCPFLKSSDIKKGMELLTTGDSGDSVDSVDSVISVSDYADPIQLACILKGNDIIPIFDNLTSGLTNSKFIQKYCKPNGGFYMSKWDNLIENRNFFKGNVKAVNIPKEDMVDIDYEIDLKIAEILYNERISQNTFF